MEGKTSSSKYVLIALLLMSVVIGETQAIKKRMRIHINKKCYAGCFILCAPLTAEALAKCGAECLIKCHTHHHLPFLSENSLSLESVKEEHTEYFCGLGCAASLCTNISTREDPAVEKVEGCLDSCSETCAKP